MEWVCGCGCVGVCEEREITCNADWCANDCWTRAVRRLPRHPRVGLGGTAVSLGLQPQRLITNVMNASGEMDSNILKKNKFKSRKTKGKKGVQRKVSTCQQTRTNKDRCQPPARNTRIHRCTRVLSNQISQHHIRVLYIHYLVACSRSHQCCCSMHTLDRVQPRTVHTVHTNGRVDVNVVSKHQSVEKGKHCRLF